MLPAKSSSDSLSFTSSCLPRHPLNQNCTGQVTYNNISASLPPLLSTSSGSCHIPALACFVGAADVLSPFLTVRETLLFAGACLLPIPTAAYLASSYFKSLCQSSSYSLHPSFRSSLLSIPPFSSHSCLRPSTPSPSQRHILLKPSVRRAFAAHRTDLILSLLHLTSCQHTRVGSVSSRGISGGERRRLSLGEALMGDFAVTCFDEVHETFRREGSSLFINRLSNFPIIYTLCLPLADFEWLGFSLHF